MNLRAPSRPGTIRPDAPTRDHDPIQNLDPTRRVDRHLAHKVSRLAAFLAFIGVTLLGSPHALAANAEALERYSEAGAAFAVEDYSKARALFDQAIEAGMEGPAVHYNVGAAAYLGGDLPRAERAFREVARTPTMAALAYYNLGLVALQRRDENEARDWFQRAYDEQPADEPLRELASRRLAELPEARTQGQLSYYTRGGAGHDDNVALRSGSIDSTATGDADSFAELLFAGSYSFGSWRIDGGGLMLKYQELDEFSQNSFYLGGARAFRLGKWYFDVGAYGSQLSLGGDVFERDVSGGLQVARIFYGDSRLRAQLRATSVEGQGLFTGLTGERTEVGLYFDKPWRRWNFGAHTRGENNDSEDPVFASRWVQLGAEARYAFSPYWGFSAGAAVRRTRHPAQAASLTGWDDDRMSWQVSATRTLWKQAQLLARYEYESNDSPVAGYNYDRSRILASVEFWY